MYEFCYKQSINIQRKVSKLQNKLYKLFTNYLQCSGVAMQQNPFIYWCCLVTEPEVKYRKPGEMVLYYKSDTTLKCQTGWAGINCDACVPKWIGPNCDACEGFGFSAESNCTECIQNGKWTGTWINDLPIAFFLTFEGPECTNVVPGMSTRC